MGAHSPNKVWGIWGAEGRGQGRVAAGSGWLPNRFRQVPGLGAISGRVRAVPGRFRDRFGWVPAGSVERSCECRNMAAMSLDLPAGLFQQIWSSLPLLNLKLMLQML